MEDKKAIEGMINNITHNLELAKLNLDSDADESLLFIANAKSVIGLLDNYLAGYVTLAEVAQYEDWA